MFGVNSSNAKGSAFAYEHMPKEGKVFSLEASMSFGKFASGFAPLIVKLKWPYPLIIGAIMNIIAFGFSFIIGSRRELNPELLKDAGMSDIDYESKMSQISNSDFDIGYLNKFRRSESFKTDFGFDFN